MSIHDDTPKSPDPSGPKKPWQRLLESLLVSTGGHFLAEQLRRLIDRLVE